MTVRHYLWLVPHTRESNRMTSLKTLSMYLRAAKTEAEDAGESTDGMAESVSKLRDEILALTGNKVDLYDQNGDFKSTIQIMRELSSVWQELSDVSQANILERIGGKRNASVIASLLQNFQETEKALKVSQSAEGSALRENEKYLDSIQGRLDVLKATGQAIATDLLDPASVKTVMGFIQFVATGLEKITNALGGVPTALLGGGLFAAFKNLDQVRAIGSFQHVLNLDATWSGTSQDVITNLANGLKKLSPELQTVALQYSKLSKETMTSIFMTNGMDEALAKAKAEAIAASTGTGALSGSFSVLGVKIRETAAGLWTFLTTDPVGWAILAAAAIIGLAKAFDYVNKAQDRAIERAQEAQDAYEDSASKIESLKSQLDEVNSKIAEINSNGPLSITNKEQLSLLESERQELERELEIQSAIARLNKSEAARAAHEALNKGKVYRGKDDKFYNVSSVQDGLYADYHEVDGSEALDVLDSRTTSELAEAQWSRLESLRRRRSEYLKSVEDDLSSMTASQAKQYKKNIEAFQSAISKQEGALGSTMDELRTERARLIDDATGEALAGYESDVSQIDDLLDQLVTYLKEANTEIDQVTTTAATTPLAMSKATRDAYSKAPSEAPAFQRPEAAAAQAVANWQAYQDALSSDNEKLNFKIDLEAESTGIETVQTALQASTEAAGVNETAIAALTERYNDLPVAVGFDANTLFERTANGFHLNTDEALRLEAALQKVNQNGINDKMQVLTEQLDDVNNQLSDTTNLSVDQVDALLRERGAISEKIVELQNEATAYAALTSNYNQWLAAQKNGEEGDMYDNIVKGYENAKNLFDSGLTGTNEFREYVELVSGKDLSTEPIKAVVDEWNRLNQVSSSTGFAPLDYLSEGSAGIENFISSVQKAHAEWVTFDEETQSWTLDIDSVDQLADELNIDSELVDAILKKASDYGVTVNRQLQDSFGNYVQNAEDALSVLQADLDSNGIKLDLDTTDVDVAFQQIQDFDKLYWDCCNKDGVIDLNSDKAQAAYSIMSKLWEVWTNLTHGDSLIFNIDSSSITDTSSDADHLLGAIDNVIEAQNTLAQKNAYHLDTEEAQSELDGAMQKLQELYGALDDKTKHKLGITLDENSITSENIQQVLSAFDSVSAEIWLKVGASQNLVQDYLDDGGKSTETALKIAKGKNLVQTWLDEKHSTDVEINPIKTAFNLWLAEIPTKHVKVVEDPSGGNDFQGSAHAGGVWGTKRAETALTGELGQELVVDTKTGRWYTVGDHGAEFAHIPSGAIVFNHKQTEQLFKYGRISSRGTALASGTAYAVTKQSEKKFTGFTSLNDNARGTTVIGNKPLQQAVAAVTDTAKTVTKTTTTTTSKVTQAVDDTAETVEEEASNLTDWVETVLSNIEKKTEKYLAKAEKKAEAGNYSGAAKQYQKALNTYDKSIGKHGDAENLYMRQANSALSKAISSGTITKEMAATIQKRVANGAMDISKLSDGTKAVVDAYKEYYDKAVAAADATMELYDKYEETAKKMYQLPLDQASAKTDKLKNSYELLEKKLEAATSAARKQSLMEQEIANLRQQHAAVSRASETATASYRTAKHRVNETTDRALSGLSDAAKAKVVAKVQQNMVIDVTALTGLTSAGKQAIIDYNAALVAQQDALHNLQMSSLETAASIDELQASIVNLANDKADAKIEKRHKYDDVRDAKYESQSTKGKNRMLNREIDRYQKDYDNRATALSDTQDEFNKLWNSKRIKNLAKQYGVQEGQKFNLKKLDPKSKDYAQASLYNATVDALGTAKHNERLAHYELVNKKSENLAKIFDNNAKAMEEKNQKTFKAAEDAEKAYENLDAAVLKMIEEHPDMTYDEAMQKVLNDTQAAYQKAAKAYNGMATTLRTWLENNRDSLNPDAIEGIENTIKGFEDQGSTMATNAANVGTQATDYANQAVVRERDNAQRAYDDIHQKNELTRASGYSVSLEDAQAEEQALNNLIAKNNELINKMKELRNAQTIGSDKWKEYQGVIDDAANQNVSLYGSLDEVKDGIKDIKFKPLNKQLQNLQDEADKTKDHMTFMQNLGMQPMISDYTKLIKNSRQQVDLLKQQRAELQAQLDAGGLTEAEYERIEQEIRDCDAAIRQAENDQAGWAKAAGDTVVGGIQAVGNGLSSGAQAIADIAGKIREMIEKIMKAMEDFRKRQINKIYRSLTRIDTKISTIKNRMELKEELGQKVSAADYVEQVQLLSEKIKKYDLDLIPRLQKQYITQKRTEGMSEQSAGDRADPDGSKTRAAYEEWQNAVTELENLRLEATKLLNSGLASALLDPLAEAKEYISDIHSLLGGISDLITDDMLFDVSGQLTEHGTQKQALLAGQYRTVQQEVQATRNEIEGLSAYLASGQKLPASFMDDYVEKWNDLAESVNNQKQIAIEMVELMRDASDAELESLQDLIDARREALQSKKDYYDYDKTIRGKTKDIQALQAQIAALEGLTDAESKAKRARLEADLATAQEDLDDTIQQHMFDLSDTALSDLSEALEKAHDEQWDKVIQSVDELLKYAAEFSNKFSDNDVSSTVEQILRSYGAITESSDKDTTMISTLLKKTLADVNSGAYNKRTYTEAATGYNDAVKQLKREGLLTDVAEIATNSEEQVQIVNERMDENGSQSSTNPNGEQSVLDQLKAVLRGNASVGGLGGTPNALVDFAILPQHIVIDFAEWTKGSWLSNAIFGGDEQAEQVQNQQAQAALDILKKLKDNKLGNFLFYRLFGNTSPTNIGVHASGARRIQRNELAWTQEHGNEEWIVRRSDGAILTPLSKGDGVLPADITSKLWALAEGKMPQMQIPKLNLPDYNSFETYAPVVNIDNSMTVEGSVDATVIDDLKKFKDEQREDIYQYISEKMYRGYIHSGGKRRL